MGEDMQEAQQLP
jgi:hypothetical protein